MDRVESRIGIAKTKLAVSTYDYVKIKLKKGGFIIKNDPPLFVSQVLKST